MTSKRRLRRACCRAPLAPRPWLTACARAVADADADRLWQPRVWLADADAHRLRQPDPWLAHADAHGLREPRVWLAHAVAHRVRERQPAPVWQPGAQLGAGLRSLQHGPRACILTSVVCGRLAS